MANNVVICGGGNGAHTLAGTMSVGCPTAHVTVLDAFEDEAERWRSATATRGFTVTYSNGKRRLYQPPGSVNFDVTVDADSCIPKADVVVICVPAFAHEVYILLVTPYLRDGCLIVGMPGHPGFEYQCASALRTLQKECTIISLETLPWACRILQYGEEVSVVGTKEEVFCAVVEPKGDHEMDRHDQGCAVASKDGLELIQMLLGDKPVLRRCGSVIGCTLLSKTIIHPPIMYAKWNNWDRTPLQTAPLFYQGADDTAAEYLDGVNNEVIAIAEAMKHRFPSLDICRVPTMQEWLTEHYGDQISDKSTLKSCLQTNAAYAGLVHPMTKTSDGRFVPDFSYRYTTEDVPYGMLVLRQMASLIDVKTPVMDEIITWAQAKIGTKFIQDGKLCRVERSQARMLDAYGILTMSDLINFFE